MPRASHLLSRGLIPRFVTRGVTTGLLCLSFLLTNVSTSSALQNNRWAEDIQKFEQIDRTNPPNPGGIVFVGSSSIRMWNLAESFPDLNVINRGFGGSQLDDTVRFFDRIVTPHRPQIVVVYAGDNDIANGLAPEEVAAQFDLLVGKMKESLPLSRLVFIGIKPSISRWHLIDKVRAANSLISKKCEGSDRIFFLDIDEASLDDDGKPNADLLLKDGLHLTAEGYEIWKNLLNPLLQIDPRLSQARNLYDQFHPWKAPNSLEEWKTLRENLQTQLRVSLGLYPYPEKTDLETVIHGKIDQGDYTIEKVYFKTAPGLYLTGSLYRPKVIDGKIPGVLAAHGHSHDGRFNRDSTDNIAQSLNSGAEGFRSGATSYLQARAVQLARLGTTVFLYDMIGYADQGPLHHRTGFDDAQASLFLHNKMGLQTWNSIRALDFLLTLPEVDAERIGVTGESGGGTQSFILGALDERAKVVFPAVMVSTSMQGGCICENSDYLRVGVNNVALAALIAPRPLAMSCADDWTLNFEALGLPELKKVYSLYGKEELVTAKTFPQFGHNYNQPAREMMFNFFNQHLDLGIEGEIRQSDFWPLTSAEQTVFDADHALPAEALNEMPLREVMQTRDVAATDALIQSGRDEFVKFTQPAVKVMLPQNSMKASPKNFVQKGYPNNVVLTKVNLVTRGSRLPISLLQPLKRGKKIVLWIDGAGREHLFNEDGTISSPVQKILDTGVSVASLDVLLTGSTAKETNPLEFKLKSVSPAHQTSRPGEDYTGFVYGYNQTLLANRVQDLDVSIQGLKAYGYDDIHLVGTGEAGLWTLLASSRWEKGTVSSVLADLNGFRFGKIESNLDQNLIPGALKYGGIGTFLALNECPSLSIFNAGEQSDPELSRALSLKHPETNLNFLEQAPDREGIAALLLAK